MFSYNKKSGLLFSTCDWRSQSDVCCLAVTTNSLSHACRLCRREDDSLNFCPHRSDCVHAAAGWQSPWDFPGHPNYCQLCHVHHDPDHLLCHPERGRPQSAPPYAQHTHHAQLGPNGETRLVLIYLASVCALLVLGTIWMLTFSEKKNAQAFIHILPKYIGMMRPKPEEEVERKESDEDTPIHSFNGRQPGGEYFIRKINPDLVTPWRDRYVHWSGHYTRGVVLYLYLSLYFWIIYRGFST